MGKPWRIDGEEKVGYSANGNARDKILAIYGGFVIRQNSAFAMVLKINLIKIHDAAISPSFLLSPRQQDPFINE